jgi:hypothetical protein
MLPFASWMKNAGEVAPVMLLDSRHGGEAEECLRRGLRFEVLEDLLSPGHSGGHAVGRRGPLRSLASRAGKVPLVRKMVDTATDIASERRVVDRSRTRRYSQRLKARLSLATGVLERLSPETVALSGDRNLGWEPVLIRSCRDLGIPTAILPIAFASEPQSLFVSRRRRCYRADLHPSITADLGRQWALDKKTGTRILFYQPSITQALAENGMLSANPWVMGGGFSDRVMVDGEKTRVRHIQLGCQADKIVVTGHPSHDDLHACFLDRDRIRTALQDRYGVEKSTPLLIVALPQHGEHGLCSWSEHWRITREICRAAREIHPNTLVSLHPRMDAAQYGFVREEFGLHILDERLADVLPAADIFVSGFSATVRWAALCAIPAIVIDLLGLNYTFYDSMKGVRLVSTHEELRGELKKLLVNRAHYEFMKGAQADDARAMSPFDGNCRPRIMKALLAAGEQQRQ